MVCSSFYRYLTYHRYNLIIQHETLRVGVLGKKNLKGFLRTFSSWSSQRTLSAGRGKVARLFSCRQPRQFRALSTTLKRCAKSTCTGSWVWSWCKEAIYSDWDFRDGEDMRDPFGERRGKFQWKVLGEKLAMLRENNPQWFAEVRFKSSN